MTTGFSDIVNALKADPVLGKSDPVSLARLLTYVERVSFSAGEAIYKVGDKADKLFVVVSGTVRLAPRVRGGADGDTQTHLDVATGSFGEECAAGMDAYVSDANASTAVTVVPISRAHLQSLLASTPDMRNHFLDYLRGKFLKPEHRPTAAPAAKPVAAAAPAAKGAWFEILGWFLCIGLALATLWFGEALGLKVNQKIFAAIFIATAIMWIFALTDEYIPGLFALTATLMLDLVPANVVLGGFSSDAFLMALSILGLGAVITSSGLSYRFLLFLLKVLPNNQTSNTVGLMITGGILTPTLPTINGRVGLIMPLFLNMVENLKFPANSRAATGLATAAFTSVTLLSAVFLSSKSVNFVVFSLLPAQNQDEFQWLNWAFAAAVVGAASLLLYMVASMIFFRNKDKSSLSKDQVAGQLSLLGPMSKREWAGALSLVVFVVGVATSSLHRISPPWLGMAILYGLLLFGFLKKMEFRNAIDWTFLIYLGTISGIVGAFNYLGLDKILAAALPDVVSYMRTDFGIFILMLTALIFVVRLLVPISPTIVILATVFVPLSASHGVNAWVIGFLLLTLGEMWWMPYQCSYYVQFAGALKKHKVYDEKMFLTFNFILNILKILAIYASIPYWKQLGLL